jgi:lysozyme family protein
MAHFSGAFAHTIGEEGGYVNDPVDAGGETKWGICKRDHPQLDIPNLSRDDAKEIYRKEYWRYDGLSSQAIANKVFDLAVNCGFDASHRMLQKALCALGRMVTVDGKFGDKTLYAANGMPEQDLLDAIRTEAVEHYKGLVRRKPSQIRFLDGWLERAKR